MIWVPKEFECRRQFSARDCVHKQVQLLQHGGNRKTSVLTNASLNRNATYKRGVLNVAQKNIISNTGCGSTAICQGFVIRGIDNTRETVCGEDMMQCRVHEIVEQTGAEPDEIHVFRFGDEIDSRETRTCNKTIFGEEGLYVPE